MTGTITIDRLQATYVVPPDEPRPDLTRARLDAVVGARLAEACRRRFSLIDSDDGVWLIRELTFDLALEQQDEDEVAEPFAAGITRALSETIRAGPDGDPVVFFPTRPAFLAHACADLANGRLWDRWYAQAFAGVRALPLSASIATLLCNEREHLEPTLVALWNSRKLDVVLDCLTESDAAALLNAWTLPAVPTADALVVAASAITSAIRPETLRLSACDVLSILVRMRTSAPSSALPEVRGAVETILALAEALLMCGPTVVDELRAGRLESAARALAGYTSAETLPALVAALAAGGDWWRSVATWTMPQAVATPSVDGLPVATSFGGVFLLLPALVEADREALSAMPPQDAAMARLAVLATCFGRARRDAAAADAVVRILAGAASDSALHDWLASPTGEHDRLAGALVEAYSDAWSGPLSVGDASFLAGDGRSTTDRVFAVAARALLDAFARRLLGFRNSSAPYLFRNFLDVGAAVSSDDNSIEAYVADPPLALVLRMIGVNGVTVELPWVDRRVTIWLGA